MTTDNDIKKNWPHIPNTPLEKAAKQLGLDFKEDTKGSRWSGKDTRPQTFPKADYGAQELILLAGRIAQEGANARKIMEDLVANHKSVKHFLAYGFEGIEDLKNFHVTFIYYGEQSEVQHNFSKRLVDLYFNSNVTSKVLMTFDQPKMFGPGKDIRVLTPINPQAFKHLLPGLRGQLEMYCNKNVHKYPFNPHVTTDLEFFTGTIDRLCLCDNNYNVIKTWRL